MAGWDPLLLVLVACLAVIMIGPVEYLSLAGFGIIGVLAAVLLGGRMDIALPAFALAGTGTMALGVRAIGVLAESWTRDQHHPREPDEQHIWR